MGPKRKIEDQHGDSRKKTHVPATAAQPAALVAHRTAIAGLRAQYENAIERQRKAESQIETARAALHEAGWTNAQIDRELVGDDEDDDETTPADAASRPASDAMQVTSQKKPATAATDTAATEQESGSNWADLMDAEESAETISAGAGPSSKEEAKLESRDDSAAKAQAAKAGPEVPHEKSSSSTSEVKGADKRTNPKGKRACTAFFLQGTCARGDKCLYSHKWVASLQGHESFKEKLKAGTLPAHTREVYDASESKGKMKRDRASLPDLSRPITLNPSQSSQPATTTAQPEQSHSRDVDPDVNIRP